MSASDSLWERDLDESDKRSLKRMYARIAAVQFVARERNWKALLSAFKKFLSNQEDQKLKNVLLSQCAVANPEGMSRGRPKDSYAMKFHARGIAALLLNERPEASGTAVKKRVHEILAIEDEEFIASRRTVESWLAPILKGR